MKKIVVKMDKELADIIPLFLANREKDISAVENAIMRQDFSAIERIGHGMKGSGTGYGFEPITAIGLEIEKSAHEKNGARVKEQLIKLRNYLDQVELVGPDQDSRAA